MKTRSSSNALTMALIVLFGVALACLLCGCASGGLHDKSASDTKWSLFQSTSGAFAVLMPGNPKETVTDQPTSNAPPTKLHQFIVASDSSTEFGVFYNDFSTSLPYLHLVGTKWFFDTTQEDVVRRSNGRVISSNDMTFHNYPARNFRFEDTDNRLSYDMRIIVVHHRQYQLIVVSEIGTDVSKDKEIFFNSLILNSW